MFRFDCITKEDNKDYNTNWSRIPDHPYRILIVGSSKSGKTIANTNTRMQNTSKYKIVEYISNKKQKIMIVVMISLLICLVIKHLIQQGLNYLRERKLNISFAFITQMYFTVPKNIKLKSTLFHYENFKQTRASTSFIQTFLRN